MYTFSGYEWVTYSLLATGALAIVPLLLVRENYARSSIDRADIHEASTTLTSGVCEDG